MKLRFARTAALLLAALSLQAQSNPPTIAANGIVNAASFMPPPLAGSGLAQGSLISIFGSNLGPETGISADRFPLATALAGVEIQIRALDGEIFAAFPLFVSAAQINAIVPSRTPAGPARISVTRDGVTGNSELVKIVQSSFGLFGLPSYTRNAIAQRFVSPAESPLATTDTPAKPRDTVTLWGTGLGAIAGSDNTAPEAGSLDTPIEVFIGHKSAEVSYHGRAPGFAGVDQINVRIPADAAAGCYVPVWVTVRGSVHSNIATIPISADGAACTNNPNIPPPLNDAATGRIVLERTVELDAALNASPPRDRAVAEFQSAGELSNGLSRISVPTPLELAHLTLLPAPGTCLVNEPVDPNRLVLPLDVGNSITMDSGSGRVSIPRTENGYQLQSPPSALFLGPNSYQLQAGSTANFPLFDARVTSGEPAHRTGSNAWDEPRLTGAEISWTLPATAPDQILIVGRAPTTIGIPVAKPSWVCAAATDTTSFTIPSAILANDPETAANIELVSVFGPNRFEFQTDGPESGTVAYLHSEIAGTGIGQIRLASTPVRLPDGATIQAELAVTPAEEQRGLMFRRSLPADQGMLFLFSASGQYGFWMYNTLIPLDIIWIDADRRIVFINPDTPPCPPEVSTACPTYGGNAVAQYVLELAAGQAARHGLNVGDPITW